MRLSIIILIAVAIIGSVLIFVGFAVNTIQETLSPETSNQYKKLTQYKNELEKINQYNMKVLRDLEEQITNSDDDNLSQLQAEIKVIKQVIEENKNELEKIIKQLSEMNKNKN